MLHTSPMLEKANAFYNTGNINGKSPVPPHPPSIPSQISFTETYAQENGLSSTNSLNHTLTNRRILRFIEPYFKPLG